MTSASSGLGLSGSKQAEEPRPSVITRRSLTAVLAMLMAAPLAIGLPASPAHAAQPRTRVIVTLNGADRRSEQTRLFEALQGYDYRVVSVSKQSPTVVLDASKQAIRRIQSLPFVASVQEDVASGIPEQPVQQEYFRVRVRREADFYAAVKKVQAALSDVDYKLRFADKERRQMIVTMRQKDMTRLSVLREIESVVLISPNDPDIAIAVPGGNGNDISDVPEQPIAQGEVRNTGGRQTTRVIVSYGSGDRKRQERRILAALDGTYYKVAKRFAVTRAIVLDVDERAMRRLRRLDGIRIQADSLSAPSSLSAPN